MQNYCFSFVNMQICEVLVFVCCLILRLLVLISLIGNLIWKYCQRFFQKFEVESFIHQIVCARMMQEFRKSLLSIINIID